MTRNLVSIGESRAPSMKRSTSSPYFPRTLEGPTKSSYFRSGRCRGKMANGQETHRAATRPAAGIEAQRSPATRKTVYLERTAGDTIDGQLPERESYHSHRANRKIRRARERRRKRKARKLNRSDNDIGVVPPPAQLDGGELSGGGVEILGAAHNAWENNTKGRGVVSVAGTEGVGVGQKVFGAGPPLTGKSKTDERERRKGIRRAQIPVMGTTVGTEPLREYPPPPPPPPPPLPPSRKRKRNETFGVVITKSVPIHGISGAQVHGHEGGSRKANWHPVKSAGACDESPNSQDDTPKGFILGVDTRELRTRSISRVDGFEIGPRKRKRNAKPIKEGAPHDDSTSVTALNCALPQHTRNVLAHHTTGRESVEHCVDAVGLVRETTMERPAKSLRKSGRNTIRKTGDISSYFASSEVQKTQKVINEKDKGKKKRAPAGASVISWPPLTAKTFGLIQEELGNDAYQVIVAAVFLNKTRGAVAAPLLRQFLVDYPSPLALSQGNLQKMTAFLQPLGLHRTRASRLIQMGKTWVGQPPTPGVGTAKRNYPASDTQPFSFSYPLGEGGGWPKLGVERNCVWEIAHLPGVGAYALDSWRIFCLDRFRNGLGRAGGKEGEEQKGWGGSEEWMRVVPKDKELRAYLRWRWAKEGWASAGGREVGAGDNTYGEA